MKRVLITGANSYIGTHVEKWLLQKDDFQVNVLDVQDETWKELHIGKKQRIMLIYIIK